MDGNLVLSCRDYSYNSTVSGNIELIFKPDNKDIYSKSIYILIHKDNHKILGAYHKATNFDKKFALVNNYIEIPIKHSTSIFMEEINYSKEEDCFKVYFDLDEIHRTKGTKPICLK